MRYKLRIRSAEYGAAVLPLFDGVKRLIKDHSEASHGGNSVWHGITTYLLLAVPLLPILQYWYGYADLTPSALEYRGVWGRRTIFYGDIERVKSKNAGRGNSNVIEIYGATFRKLSLKLQHPAAFVTELRQYAHPTLWEGLEE